MAVASGPVWFLLPPIGKVVEHSSPIQDGLLGPIPCIFAGKGTPNDDFGAFLAVPKGSVYIQMDAVDDEECLFLKVDDSGAGNDDDWDGIPLEDATD
jgi:hypothetical protein